MNIGLDLAVPGAEKTVTLGAPQTCKVRVFAGIPVGAGVRPRRARKAMQEELAKSLGEPVRLVKRGLCEIRSTEVVP